MNIIYSIRIRLNVMVKTFGFGALSQSISFLNLVKFPNSHHSRKRHFVVEHGKSLLSNSLKNKRTLYSGEEVHWL